MVCSLLTTYTRNGEPLAARTVPQGLVTSQLVVSADGQVLAVGTAGGDMPVYRCLDLAEAGLTRCPGAPLGVVKAVSDVVRVAEAEAARETMRASGRGTSRDTAGAPGSSVETRVTSDTPNGSNSSDEISVSLDGRAQRQAGQQRAFVASGGTAVPTRSGGVTSARGHQAGSSSSSSSQGWSLFRMLGMGGGGTESDGPPGPAGSTPGDTLGVAPPGNVGVMRRDMPPGLQSLRPAVTQLAWGAHGRLLLLGDGLGRVHVMADLQAAQRQLQERIKQAVFSLA